MYKEYPKFRPEEVLVYLRKSRSDDADLTVEEVLTNHEKDVNRWAEENATAPLLPDNYYREVVSGESIRSRNEFQKLLRRIESPDIAAVVVKDCARLGRPDLQEIGTITNIFRFSTTYVISLKPYKVFDLKDPWDREQFEREMMRNRDYLDYTKGILKAGKEISLRGGHYINGVTPYGYEKDETYEGKRKRPTLKIVEEEAKVVRMIFDWYVNEELGAMKICQRLNAMGIKARKGGVWKKSSVYNILKNEHYLGKIVIRKHVDVKTVEESEIVTRCLLNKEYEIVDGKHPAIIDEETFDKANNKISKHISVKPNLTLLNPFASILKCQCGRVMIRRRNRNTFRYLCDEQTFCGNASVGEVELKEAIIAKLKDSIDDLSVQVADDEKDNKKEKHIEYVSLLEAKYIELEKKELSLWDKYSEENMPKQIFDKLMANCLEDKQKIETALEIAYNNVPTNIDYKGAIATLHNAIDALSDDSVPASATNKLLLSVVDKIVYRRPKAVRMTVEEAKEKGVKLQGGWYCPEFELDIYLKV